MAELPDDPTVPDFDAEDGFTAHYNRPSFGVPGRGSALGWFLALAFAVGSGVLVKYYFAARADLAQLRAQAGSECEIVARPAPRRAAKPQSRAPVKDSGSLSREQEAALLATALTQAARVEELEKELLALNQKPRRATVSTSGSRHKSGTTTSELRAQIARQEKTIAEWQKVSRLAQDEIRRLRRELEGAEATLDEAAELLERARKGRVFALPAWVRERLGSR